MATDPSLSHHNRNLTARAQRAFAKRHPGITVLLKRVVGTTTQGAAVAVTDPDASRAQALAAAGFVFGRATPRKYVSINLNVNGSDRITIHVYMHIVTQR